jgi:hypothetical protein
MAEAHHEEDHMRKIITSVCTAALLATVIVGTWAMTPVSSANPTAAPAAMNPFEMMLNAPALPVHVIVDAV